MIRKSYFVIFSILTIIVSVYSFSTSSNSSSFSTFTTPSALTALDRYLDSKTIQIDARLLIHLVGDVFARESGLEGADPLEVMIYLQQLVELRSDLDALPSLLKWRDKLKQAQGLVQAFRDSDERFERELLSQYDNLPIGESLFWPAGWKGHAVSYHLTKQSEERLRFRVYNIGEGAENHVTVFCGEKELVMPYREISNICTRDFLNPVFLTLLRDLKFTDDREKPVKCNDLYRVVFSTIRGEMMMDHIPDQLVEPQSSGVCAYLSIITALPQELNDSKLAAQIRFEMQFKALWDYSQGLKKNQEQLSSSWALLEKALYYFESDAQRYYDGQLPVSVMQRIKEMKILSDEAHQLNRGELSSARHLPFAGTLSEAIPARHFILEDFPHATRHGSDVYIPRLAPLASGFNWFAPVLQPAAQSSVRVFRYQLKEGRLISADIEANLYLALLYLCLQQYESAKLLLDVVKATEVTDSSREILSWMAQSFYKTHDHDPRANALRLKAVVLSGARATLPGKVLKVAYYDYLQRLDRFAEPWLSASEENLLVSLFPRQTLRMQRLPHYVLEAKPSKPLVSTEIAPSRFLDAWEEAKERSGASLVRPCVLSRFEIYYKLAKHGIWSSRLGERRLTDPQDIVRLFHVLKQSSLSEIDAWTARVLEQVASHPERFPSSNELHQILKNRSKMGLERVFKDSN